MFSEKVPPLNIFTLWTLNFDNMFTLIITIIKVWPFRNVWKAETFNSTEDKQVLY